MPSLATRLPRGSRSREVEVGAVIIADTREGEGAGNQVEGEDPGGALVEGVHLGALEPAPAGLFELRVHAGHVTGYRARPLGREHR